MPAITFLGHGAFLVELEKARLVIDPFLSGNPAAGCGPEAVEADYVLLTHGHPDHLGDGIEIARRCGATIIAPFELATHCERQGARVHAMHIGGAHDFPFGRVKLTIAFHGSGLPVEDGILYLGNPCGFLVIADGATVYHAGDTGLFYDMKLIGEMNRIDVALLPIGGNFTMDADDAVKAAELLGAGLSVPMHYGTFDVIKADPADFVRKAAARGLRAKALAVGERLVL
ncbi:MAG: metal-dependent hydrolase [bacterium]|nr:metal-dependent hydrolase [bacterium]